MCTEIFYLLLFVVCLFVSECEQLVCDLGRGQQQPPPAHPHRLSCRTQGAYGDVLVSAGTCRTGIGRGTHAGACGDMLAHAEGHAMQRLARTGAPGYYANMYYVRILTLFCPRPQQNAFTSCYLKHVLTAHCGHGTAELAVPVV